MNNLGFKEAYLSVKASVLEKLVEDRRALLKFARLVSHSVLLAPEWKREADKVIAAIGEK